jgi:hypothetical protein
MEADKPVGRPPSFRDNSRVDSPHVPFRWDLVGPDQIGTLLSGTKRPDLWFLPELIECTGNVLARSGNGDLCFLGRSLDSMFDLLGGALADTKTGPDVHRLPWSFTGESLTQAQRTRAREICAELGLDPGSLVRRRRPLTFVDVVAYGRTFTALFTLLTDWLDELREPWDVLRRKLRFVGVPIRGQSSPKSYRWSQHAPWTSRLPANAVQNVSLDWWVWDYFGNKQPKLTRSFHAGRWLAESLGPDHRDETRQALAEAIAISLAGREGSGRRALARAIRGEPALAQAWLRDLVRELNA